MSEEKVRVVFEFDKEDYKNVLFLMGEEKNASSEELWNVMSERDIEVSLDYIAKHTGAKRNELLTFLVSLAVVIAEKRLNNE